MNEVTRQMNIDRGNRAPLSRPRMVSVSRRILSMLIVIPLLPLTLIPAPPPKPLPSLPEQAEIQRQWLKLRRERLLPRLIRKHGVAMWLVICREYNEDPVFFSLVSPTLFAARRRTIYVFYDRGSEKGIERLAIGGGPNGGRHHVLRHSGTPGPESLRARQWDAPE